MTHDPVAIAAAALRRLTPEQRYYALGRVFDMNSKVLKSGKTRVKIDFEPPVSEAAQKRRRVVDLPDQF